MKKQMLIELYEVQGDAFLGEIDISHYDRHRVNLMCPPNDPIDVEYCNSCFVEEIQFERLKEAITELYDYDYRDFAYYLITRAS